ncbi:methyl-accepting chemotaxis protein [Novosphingobium sp. M1R2S20]|uniref:Methyl-accepting chemotaxis protein n=1 Tax=Novosphingobium rhizovicinum TaxID=3228928 RepID=A0ABV3RA01_9SPHN
MNWFQEVAPIRQKTLVAFGFLTMLTGVTAISSVFGNTLVTLGVGLIATALSALLGSQFRRAICDPYVTTVVRMEGLAAGDLQSPIQFTHYKDCVGRMTAAMFTFRETALQQQAHTKEQKAVVDLLSEHLRSLAAGDLTATVADDLPVSYSGLKTNFNDALHNLSALVSSITESASVIRTGSGEIAQASEDLARRTESNAASLQETSAAVTQIDGRLKASVEAASRTVEKADDAIATVANGRKIADQVVESMSRVSESAKGIDSVIEGLDKIAFQTRVLAMNAAVEAGRAGEAGRGFAVVADLVSALAMRAEEEAKRARDQLTVTQSEIGTAVDAVGKVDGALVEISTDVRHVHELLAQMATDNQVQASAITQIAVATSAMDEATQQNAAMVEETSAAARNLAQEVQALAAETSRFKTDAAEPTGTRRTASPHLQAPPAPRLAQIVNAMSAQVPSNDWHAF